MSASLSMTPRHPTDGQRGYATANRVLVVVFVALLLALAALRPEGDGLSAFGWRLPETCLVQRQYGRPCRGCGLTRSVVALLHGDWAESRRQHPHGVAVLAFLVSQAALRWILARASRARFWPWDVATTATGLLLVFGSLLRADAEVGTMFHAGHGCRQPWHTEETGKSLTTRRPAQAAGLPCDGPTA